MEPKSQKNIRPKVFIALSGGVDSSVAAALLKRCGCDVVGAHIKMWSDPKLPCTAKEDRLDAMRVAARLGIPFETWDFTEEYRKAVVEYMIREYASGRTPNPDVMCNKHIKFGMFLKRALEKGADYVATGHYVRLEPEFSIINYQFSNDTKRTENLEIENSLKIENCKLKIAKDINKDQSYFLWTLTQEQLKHCLFPIGDYTKPEVREMARKFGLPTAEKPDSQGVCFIGEFDMAEFLKNYIPERKGAVLTAAGQVVGEHHGAEFYTIGERHGLAIGGGIPYYVTAKDPDKNTLTVAAGPYDESLFKPELIAEKVNWISGQEPKMPLRCQARIRYRQPLQRCKVYKFISSQVSKSETYKPKNLQTYKLSVIFDEPQRAVTPGQSVVFYKDGEMLGGGIIA